MLKQVEITVSEKMVCLYCGHEFDGISDLCVCLTVMIQESIATKNALKKQREFKDADRLELDR